MALHLHSVWQTLSGLHTHNMSSLHALEVSGRVDQTGSHRDPSLCQPHGAGIG